MTSNKMINSLEHNFLAKLLMTFHLWVMISKADSKYIIKPFEEVSNVFQIIVAKFWTSLLKAT